MLKPTIFREYDIRGVAEVDLAGPDVEVLGRAIGTYLRRRGATVLNLGRDCRLSSPVLHDALAKGLIAAGSRLTDIGVVPTPVLYHSVFDRKAEGAVMITGSHNPPEYNGFKVMLGQSTIHGDDIQEIRKLIEAGDLDSGEGAIETADAVSDYVDAVTSRIKLSRRVKAVFDAGNGTAGPVMRAILERLNCDATELYFEMDGRFPNHHPDPTVEKYLAPLVAAVREQKAELGVAFDGDSDRVGATDEHGNVIWGDMLMLIYAREILKRKPGATFIGEVKCSQVLYDEIRRLGGNAIMYRTGHSLIKAKMKETHAELAGEMSGHIFFSDRYYGFDDAMYAACRLLEIVADSGRPLSAQLEGVPKMVVTPEIRVDCPDERKFEVVARVVDHFKKIREVIDVDGARVLFEKGWGLVRASNTQPVLVLRFEASDSQLLEKYRAEVDSALAQAKAACGVK
ncbi:MAG: phosphomannomutase/phosphoglucomutase [Bryobacterales bacterium]|nr:phosphomannomutase/phosphoglucomutase [Bryobacterales bacterium]